MEIGFEELPKLGIEIPEDGTKCVMSLKKSSSDRTPIWEKETVVSDGSAYFFLESEDTQGLPFGNYEWDIRLFFRDGIVVTPFKPQLFAIERVVGNNGS